MNETLNAQAEEQAKLDGIRLAASHAPVFIDKVLVLIRAIPKGNQFTICKIRRTCDEVGIINTGHPNAWGAVMKEASRLCLIRKVTGHYRPSTTPGCHRRQVQMWERMTL